MPEEGFLRRWARVKASAPEAAVEAPARPAPPPAVVDARPAGALPGASAEAAQQAALTLDDAARLTPSSDFSAFVSQGVDKDVRRLALKKLFADPHFNVMDKLDMYMDDYNKPDPVSATMLAALQHARGVLRSPEEVQAEIARLAARDAPPAVIEDADLLPGEPVEAQEEDEPIALAGELPAGDAEPADQQAQAIPAPQAPPAGEECNDAIALTIVRAHNAEARP